jgi:hypothetical protein
MWHYVSQYFVFQRFNLKKWIVKTAFRIIMRKIRADAYNFIIPHYKNSSVWLKTSEFLTRTAQWVVWQRRKKSSPCRKRIRSVNTVDTKVSHWTPSWESNRHPRALYTRTSLTLAYFIALGPTTLFTNLVSHRFSNAATRLRVHVRSCGICGGQSSTGAGFLRVFRFTLPIYIPPSAPPSSSSSIIRHPVMVQ